jgi:hypothetical protein
VASSGSAAQRGLWPPRHTRFLDHTQRRAIFGRTPLHEWSARRRDLSTWQHTTDKHPWPRWDLNPWSQQASGRRLRLIPRGHWDRRSTLIPTVKNTEVSQVSVCHKPESEIYIVTAVRPSNITIEHVSENTPNTNAYKDPFFTLCQKRGLKSSLELFQNSNAIDCLSFAFSGNWKNQSFRNWKVSSVWKRCLGTFVLTSGL